MKRSIIILLFGGLVCSCGLPDSFKKMKEEIDKFKKDLSQKFEYQDIEIDYNLTLVGKDEEDVDYYRFIFYKYPVGTTMSDSLKTMSEQIFTYVLAHYPQTTKVDYLEVVFTESDDPWEIKSSVNFKKRKSEFRIE